MKENLKSQYCSVKGQINKMRLFCMKWQQLFFIPKQLQAVNLGDEFADAQVEYILNFTNNIIKFTKSNEVFFFKEARERCGLRKYINKCVHEFFTDVCIDPQLESEIFESLQNKKTFKKLINLGDKAQNNSLFNAYLTSNDERFLNLPAVTEDKEGILRKFVFYIYGEITNYRYNFGVKKDSRQTFLAVRSLSVKKLADMLSLGYMIPCCCYVKMRLKRVEKYGVLAREADGEDVSRIPYIERQKFVTPSLLRELTSLNILDVLCNDDDHRVNNYHTVTDDENKYVSVMSFDNDAPKVFFPSAKVRFKHSANCSCLIDRRGLINRPHMDRGLAEAVLKLTKKSLKNFRNYLNSLQRSFLWIRIRKLQSAILKTIKTNPSFLLEKDGWTAEHIKEDLSGKYGKTYLVSFLTDYYYPDGLHPFDMC